MKHTFPSLIKQKNATAIFMTFVLVESHMSYKCTLIILLPIVNHSAEFFYFLWKMLYLKKMLAESMKWYHL